jgi:superfamily II DNA or RNA helicase/SAM-dependent methyltransferase
MEISTSNSLFGILYAHQKLCVNKIEDHFQSGYTNALVKMSCGTGKSLIQYYLSCQYQKTLLVVPSIALTGQFIKDYIFGKKYPRFPNPCMTVCSRNENKEIDIQVTTEEKDIIYFLKNNSSFFICCTYQSLKKFLSCVNFKFDLCMLDEAHRSLGTIVQDSIFGKKDTEDTEMYEDDLYDTDLSYSSDESEISQDSNSTEILITLQEVSKKQLYFTATPKNFNGKKMTGPNSDCGELIFDYSLRQGVEDAVLKDYEIVVNISKIPSPKEKKIKIFEAISRNALSTNNYRIMLFHTLASPSEKKPDLSSVSDYTSPSSKKLFKQTFQRIHREEFGTKEIGNIVYEGITASTSSNERKDILERFEESKDTDVFLISSCRTIGEGVDTKMCNHICWVDPKQSIADIIQNIGRATRNNEKWGIPSKTKATITIPVFIDVSKYEECANDVERDEALRDDIQTSENWDPILNVLSALKQDDPEYFEICLRYPKKFCQKEYERNNKLTKRAQEEYEDKQEIEHDQIIKDGKQEVDHHLTAKKIEEYANSLDTPVELYTNSMEEPTKLIGEEKEGEVQRIYGNDETGEIFDMEEKEKGKGIQIPKRKKTNIRTHVDPEIRVLWKIREGYDFTKDMTSAFLDCQVVDNEEKWMENYEKLKEFVQTYNSYPSPYIQNIRTKDEKILGRWIEYQRRSYRLKRSSLTIDKIKLLESINGWFWNQNLDDEWFKNYELLLSYVNQHKKLPSEKSPDEDIKKLAKWCASQRSNKRENGRGRELDDEKIKLLDEITGWYWEMEDKWLEMRNETFNFARLNGRLPNTSKSSSKDEKILGRWVNKQRECYKCIKSIPPIPTRAKLTEERIKLLEEIPGWYWDISEKIKVSSRNLSDIDKLWLIKRNNVLDFVKKNNRLPSTSIDVSEEEKELGIWVNNQRRAHKCLMDNIHTKARLNEERIKLLEEIPGWYWHRSEKSKKSSSSKSTPVITPHSSSPPKPRSYLRPIPNPKEEKSSSRTFSPSALSTFHKKFKGMSSSTYFNHIQPEEFKEYHRLAQEAEEHDNPEDKPLNIIADQLNQLPSIQKIADLGCGDATLSTLCTKHKFTNIDAFALNDKVQVCNITKLPQKFRDSFDVVVLSRAMWATNKKDVLNEAKRILKPNGKIFICEPFKRWNWNKEEKKFGENRLDKLLNANGFSIQSEENTQVENGMYPKFMYYECMKKRSWTKSNPKRKDAFDDLDKELEDIDQFCKSK